MYTSSVATILSSMWMGYLSLTQLDSIPHIRALMQSPCILKECGHGSVELQVVTSANV